VQNVEVEWIVNIAVMVQ